MILSSKAVDCINEVSVLGAGQVFQQRILPAVLELAPVTNLTRVGVFDLKEERYRNRPVNSLAISYHKLNQGSLATQMQRAGALGSNALVIVATPTVWHVDNAFELAQYARFVAVEKPIAIDPVAACRLREFGDRIVPIDHQLYKPELLSLLADARNSSVRWSEVERLEFRLCESSCVGNRQIDDAIYDLGYHGLACMLVALRTSFFKVEIKIDETVVSTYHSSPDNPQNFTAARVEGRFLTPTAEIPFTVSVGKGLSKSQKGLRLRGRSDRTIRQVSLNESGHYAHKRVLRSLLDPNDATGQLIDVNDSIQVVQACADALSIARTSQRYEFATTPRWLTTRSEFNRAVE